GGRLHPLLGRYGPEVLSALEAALERRAPLTEAVAELGPRRITARELRRFGEPRLLLANVNTAADRAWAERELPSVIAQPLSERRAAGRRPATLRAAARESMRRTPHPNPIARLPLASVAAPTAAAI